MMTLLLLSSALVFNATDAEASSRRAPKAKEKAPASKLNVSQDVDTLGGNAELLKKAAALDANNRTRIVQSRQVDRNLRLEVGVSYNGVAGGDNYLRTQGFGAAVDFHITPRWSVGLRYSDFMSALTPEGERVFQNAREAYNAGGRTYVIPDIDYPLRSYMAVINWYPVYGKTSLFETRVAQFDMYLLGGGGQIELSSGNTRILTGGAGVGVWISNRISGRGEIRYQNYEDKIITGPRSIHTVVGQVGLGFLF
jgi:outer membrane beta-barrel protein